MQTRLANTGPIMFLYLRHLSRKVQGGLFVVVMEQAEAGGTA